MFGRALLNAPLKKIFLPGYSMLKGQGNKFSQSIYCMSSKLIIETLEQRPGWVVDYDKIALIKSNVIISSDAEIVENLNN